MVGWEWGGRNGSNGSTKRTGWVETSTSEVDSDQVADEKRDTDSGWSPVTEATLNTGHDNSNTENAGSEGLDEDTSGARSTTAESVGVGNVTWGHGTGGQTGKDSCNELGDDHNDGSDRSEGTNEQKRNSNGWVEVTTGNLGGENDTDHNTESETEGDHDDLGRVGSCGLVGLILVGGLSDHVGGPKENEGSKELTGSGDQVVLSTNRESKLGLVLGRAVSQLLLSVSRRHVNNWILSSEFTTGEAGTFHLYRYESKKKRRHAGLNYNPICGNK